MTESDSTPKPFWLPSLLSQEDRKLVASVSASFGYGGRIPAFCVALLEDCNYHRDAAAVNAVLELDNQPAPALIAASSELLAMIERLLNGLEPTQEDMRDGLTRFILRDDCRVAARELIAKAKGAAQ